MFSDWLIAFYPALKETKALSVPKNKYTEEDLPTVDLDYGTVSNQHIMETR